MSQRPQRAAAIQANQANTALLASGKRCSSRASDHTITSPRVRHHNHQDFSGASPPDDSSMMQGALFQEDPRRLAGSADSANSNNLSNDASGGSNVLQLYWPGTDEANLNQAQQSGGVGGAHYWNEHGGPSASSFHHDQPMYATGSHRPLSPRFNAFGMEHDTDLHVGPSGALDLATHSKYDQRYEGKYETLSIDPSDSMSLLASLPIGHNSHTDNESYEDSTDSDLPPEKKKLSPAFRPRGRKKRNKCTPEQLRSLEAFFEKNRNPTGRIRHELSRKLRMPERSVQVWFQNRRAKVKTVERKGVDSGSDTKARVRSRVGDKDSADGSASGRSGGVKGEGSDGTPSVTAFPTSALCVGTWRRVSPLICFFSRRLQSMTWYLTSESIGFKLEIPWTSIRAAYFDGPTVPSIAERAEGVRVPLGHFVIDLERPPTFFMEVFRSAPGKNGSDTEQKTSWRQCEDFTEHRQATTVSRHILNGPYEELRDAVLALARSNDVLEKMIEFRDKDRRAAGEIPVGSSSTAENFGMIGTNGRTPIHFTPATSLSQNNSPAGAFDDNMHLPSPAPPPMGVAPAQGPSWSMFRSPSVHMEGGWEFDSPASITTSLSENSFDSFHRYPMCVGPGSYYGTANNAAGGLAPTVGWKEGYTSVDASPRSGLGSSMDLNGLRIDTAGISSYGTPSMSVFDGGHLRMDSSSYRTDGSWDGNVSAAESAPAHGSGYAVSGDILHGHGTSGRGSGSINSHANSNSYGHFHHHLYQGNSGTDTAGSMHACNMNLDQYSSSAPASEREGLSRSGYEAFAHRAAVNHDMETSAASVAVADVDANANATVSVNVSLNAENRDERGKGEGLEHQDGDGSHDQHLFLLGLPSHGGPPSRRLARLDEDMYSGPTPTAENGFGNRTPSASISHGSGNHFNTGMGAGGTSYIHPDLVHHHHHHHHRRYGQEEDIEEVQDEGMEEGGNSHGRGRANTYRQADYNKMREAGVIYAKRREEEAVHQQQQQQQYASEREKTEAGGICEPHEQHHQHAHPPHDESSSESMRGHPSSTSFGTGKSRESTHSGDDSNEGHRDNHRHYRHHHGIGTEDRDNFVHSTSSVDRDDRGSETDAPASPTLGSTSSTPAPGITLVNASSSSATTS